MNKLLKTLKDEYVYYRFSVGVEAYFLHYNRNPILQYILEWFDPITFVVSLIRRYWDSKRRQTWD